MDTTSGVGTLQSYTVTPDKLVGDGFLIDYVRFVRDVGSETTDYVPNAERAAHLAADARLILPPVGGVYFRIAEQLNLRHLKLSDCLNTGSPGDARWNRTVYGRLGARNVQRSLSGLLGVELSDVELAAICYDCADRDGRRMQPAGRMDELPDGGLRLPAGFSARELAARLDDAEVSAGALAARINE